MASDLGNGSVIEAGIDAVSLTVATCTNPICPADYNGDGSIDFFDYNEFVVCLEGGVCPPGKSADFNNDGSTDFFDYNDFIIAYELPCP